MFWCVRVRRTFFLIFSFSLFIRGSSSSSTCVCHEAWGVARACLCARHFAIFPSLQAHATTLSLSLSRAPLLLQSRGSHSLGKETHARRAHAPTPYRATSLARTHSATPSLSSCLHSAFTHSVRNAQSLAENKSRGKVRDRASSTTTTTNTKTGRTTTTNKNYEQGKKNTQRDL